MYVLVVSIWYLWAHMKAKDWMASIHQQKRGSMTNFLNPQVARWSIPKIDVGTLWPGSLLRLHWSILLVRNYYVCRTSLNGILMGIPRTITPATSIRSNYKVLELLRMDLNDTRHE
jgi:hypothetical protein